MKVGKHIIPERITHAPWFELFKMGLLTKNNNGNLGKTTYDATRAFFTNAPGSEISKAFLKALKGDYSETGKAGLGNVIPQAHLELTNDYATNRSGNRFHR